jgi:AcrR family transcriptional regulator
MSGDTSVRPRRERRKEARPSELTAAALDLFVERGFAATRLEDIAARAGVSKGTLYLYFAGKEDLFKAVVREGIVPALTQAETLIADHRGSASDLLRSLIRGWWQLIGSTPLGGITKLMIAEARNFPEIAQFYYDEVLRRAHGLMRRVLLRGQESGEFRAGDVDTWQQLVFSPFIMFAVWRHSLACCDARAGAPEAYIEAALDFVLRGLRSDPGSLAISREPAAAPGRSPEG